MSNKIKKLRSDIPGYFFRMLRKMKIRYNLFTGTIRTRISCYLRRITLGEKCKFYGKPVMYRNPHCKISIGNNCTFRSDITNNIGINTKCLLYARGENSIIEIGNNSALNGVVISSASAVKVGNDVLIGYHTLLTDYDAHPLDPDLRRQHTGKGIAKPITIEDNVWIGANVTILKGVRIGKNTVIAANSFVASSIPENVLASGNPCKAVMPLTMYLKMIKI